MTKQKYFIIDFDSTFVKSEGLEVLASIVLEKNENKNMVLSKIKNITNLAMEGKISFEESLSQRVFLLKARRKDIEQVVKILKKNISPSIKRNKNFFKTYRQTIYIVSGGFKEFINPIISSFGIANDHILANTFIFDKRGKITGYDKKNPLAKSNGKVNVVKSLHLNGDIYVIGDGYTDYQLRELGVAKKFIAFTENVKRENVLRKADHIAPSFDEFLYINKLPMTISYPKSRIKVLLHENIHPVAADILQKEGYSVEWVERRLETEELYKKISDISILGVRTRTQINEELLKRASKLIAVGAYCVGTDQISNVATDLHGVAAFNAPYSNTRSVVELTLGEIIMLMRGIFTKSTKLHQGIWEKSSKNAYEVRGKKLGIIGYGNIGSQLSILAEALGMEVYFYDIVEKLPLGNARKCNSMNEVLKKCDVITIHVDGNPMNIDLIGEKEFSLMKDGVIFLNLSRDFVINVDALIKHIKKGKVGGAAVDVFANEPKAKGDRFATQLQGLPNVILTPHIGGNTLEAQKNIGEFVTNKIIEYINTGNTFLSVNFPQIQLPKLINAHRLLHLHRNIPGILAKINGVLAKNNINILGQYLKTSEQVGYVITDVNKKYDKNVLKELKQIPNTIRFRVLY